MKTFSHVSGEGRSSQIWEAEGTAPSVAWDDEVVLKKNLWNASGSLVVVQPG